MNSAIAVSRGASYLTLQTLVTSIAQVLSFAILARMITASEVGILAILSLITALSLAISGGAFQQASMKYVGEYAEANKDFAASVLYRTIQLSTLISIPLACFVFLGSGFLAKMLLGTASQAGLFRVLAVDVFAFAGALPVAMGAVLGAKRFKLAATIGTIGAILRQSLIILLILLLKNFIGLVYGWILSDFATLAAYGFYAIRVVGMQRGNFPIRRLLDFSWPLSISNMVSFAYTWFDRAILIAFVSLSSLGVYSAALFAFAAMSNISGAFNNALLPVYSDIGGSRGVEGCKRAMRLGSRYVCLVMVPLAFGLLATAKSALILFVGKAYESGAVPLMVLSLAFALTAVGLVLGPMLTALGKTRAMMWITMSSVVFGLASAYVLLPFLGIVGASVARDVAMIVTLCLSILVLKRMQVLSLDFDMAWKSLVAGAAMAGVLIAAQTITSSALLLPVYITLGATIHLILLRALKAVTMRDISLIEGYLGARLGSIAGLLGAILVPAGSNIIVRPRTLTFHASPAEVDSNPNLSSLPNRVSISRTEWGALLVDNQFLMKRAEGLVRRIDELEGERKQLKKAIEEMNANLDFERIDANNSMEQAAIALRQAQEILNQLIRETDKRIGT